jgi:hypothetical protein
LELLQKKPLAEHHRSNQLVEQTDGTNEDTDRHQDADRHADTDTHDDTQAAEKSIDVVDARLS